MLLKAVQAWKVELSVIASEISLIGIIVMANFFISFDNMIDVPDAIAVFMFFVEHPSPRQLGILYNFNTKAWMTALIFQEWLLDLDKKFRIEQRNFFSSAG